jgi:hypothetical protein
MDNYSYYCDYAYVASILSDDDPQFAEFVEVCRKNSHGNNTFEDFLNYVKIDCDFELTEEMEYVAQQIYEANHYRYDG